MKRTCWALTENLPGTHSQVRGLSEAIGLPTVHKICKRRWPWGWLGLSVGNPLTQLSPESDPLTPPWPDLIISCGRRSAPLALAIKKQSQGKTFCLHIQNPIFNHASFDLIVAPEHDNIKGPNIITNKGALHHVTQEKIDKALEIHAPLFKEFPKPYSAVLLGGNTHRYKMTEAAMNDIIKKILSIRDITKGSVLVTPSFRTPFRSTLQQALHNEPRIFLAEIETLNPYLAMLGIADFIFVTDDSVNMVSEACMTGKPVYILPLLGHTGSKSLNFIQELVQEKTVRLFKDTVESWSYTPLDETKRIATLVREKLSL